MIAAHGVFFATLLLNTVFSVRFFGPMIRRDAWQWLVDAVLLAIYAGLALSIGQGTAFPFAASLLFVVAALKYLSGWASIPANVLKRKVIIDLSGALLCLASLGVALAGYPLAAAIGQAALFVMANVLLLWIRPMYRL